MKFSYRTVTQHEKTLLFALLAKVHGINNPDAILSLVLILLLSFITAES